jgi:hypothetical protein
VSVQLRLAHLAVAHLQAGLQQARSRIRKIEVGGSPRIV